MAQDRPDRRALLVEPQPFYTDRGTPIAVRYVLRALSEMGWSVDVLTFPIGQPVDLPNVRLHRVGNPLGFTHVAVGFSPQKLVLDGLLAMDLVRRLRRERYDIVHAVEEAAFLVAGLRPGRRPPMVYDMASSLPEQLAQKKAFRSAALQRGFHGAERWLLHQAGCVICSAGLAGHVRRAAPGVTFREWRFPAEEEPTDPGEVARLREELAIPAGSRVFLYLGNFAAYQGVDLLFAAAARVLAERPEAVFLCVGAATQAELDAGAAQFQGPLRDRVRLVGRQPRERVAAYLELADILVSPRSYGANFPLKLFDYLATGKAIVATGIEAHTCVLDDRIARLVPPTPEGLAQGIATLIARPDEAARHAAAALDFARRELSWDSFKALVADVYATAMAGAPRA